MGPFLFIFEAGEFKRNIDWTYALCIYHSGESQGRSGRRDADMGMGTIMWGFSDMIPNPNSLTLLLIDVRSVFPTHESGRNCERFEIKALMAGGKQGWLKWQGVDNTIRG